MERCGRCGGKVGEVPDVVWWCWWCGRALCDGCGGSDTATCGVVPRTCDRNPRRVFARPRAGEAASLGSESRIVVVRGRRPGQIPTDPE
jgi:hypothetical protein